VPDGVRWSNLATLGANVTGYIHSGAKANVNYRYRVAAFNSAGQSAFSATASLNPGTSPGEGVTGLARPATFSTRPIGAALPKGHALDELLGNAARAL
jgi:hypothetical protein